MITRTHFPQTEGRRGIALITVTFVFSAAALIAFALLSHQQLAVRHTAGLLGEAQAYQYALGGEELARQVLAADAALTPDLDHTGQDWRRLSAGMPIDNGTIDLVLEDAQGSFNINTLLGNAPGPASRLTRLLALLHLRPQLAQAIIARLNQLSAQAQSAGFAFPATLDNISVLRTVDGLGEEDLATLAPFITALPETDSPLNINTAPDELLKAYLPDDMIYRRVADTRSRLGFLSDMQLRVLGAHTTAIAVASRYFRLTARVRASASTLTLTSIIRRDMDASDVAHLRVISRNLSRGL